MATAPKTTWLLISRAAGLVIVFALLVAFLVASATGMMLDRTVLLAFLVIASGLLGVPFAWSLVKRANGGN